jgi:hypothetical protein
MTSNGKIVEGGKHKRFHLSAVHKPGHTKVGSAVDMSARELACHYVDRKEPPSRTDMDIWMIGNGFHLRNAAVKTNSGVEVIQETRYYGTFLCCYIDFVWAVGYVSVAFLYVVLSWPPFQAHGELPHRRLLIGSCA